MNVRLYDGTVRCADHMDASSYQGQTSDPCAYCPAGVSLDKEVNVEQVPAARSGLPWFPLYSHREGLRRNDLVTLASALWIEAGRRGALSPIPGTSVDGKIVPVNF